MKHITTLSIAGTLAALSGASLSAATTPARNQEVSGTYELPDYVVVAHTYEVLRTEVGSKVEVIDREDLELGQTTFVLDAIRELPGVTVRNNGGPGGSFGITTRGLNSNRPVVLIDGIEVSDPSSGRILNPGLLFSGSVDRIEFLKGPQSSLYGADALAGVINISTRDAQEGETVGSLSAGYGTYKTSELSANVQTHQGPFKLSASVSRHDSEGFSSQIYDNEADGYENTSFIAKFDYQATDDLSFYLVGYYIDAQSEYDTTWYPYTFDPSGLNSSEQLFSKIGGKLQATDNWETELGFAFTKVRGKSDSISYGASYSEGDRYEIDWRNVYQVTDRWSLAGGVEHEREDNRKADGDRDETSYYVDSNLEIVDGLHWTLGGRHDDNSAYGKNNTWRTTFSYAIANTPARLHGSYGTSFQAPSFYQLFNPTYGNPDLMAEEGIGWDLGVEVTLVEDKIIWDVTGFGYDIEDKISYDFFTSSYKNDESYESRGVESSLSWHICESLQARANYTYTEAEYEDGTTAERTPKHTANLSLLWSGLDDKLDLKTSLIYVGEQTSLRGDTDKMDDYITVNLAGQYALTETVTLWSRINNLLDEEYNEIAGYNSARFNIMAGVRIDF